MSPLSQRLKLRYYGWCAHPYAALVAQIELHLTEESVVLDVGCGRAAPTLTKFRGKAKRLIGIDVVEFAQSQNGIELCRRDLANTGLPGDSIDLMYSQAVMEHVVEPGAVFAEIARLLKPQGICLALTANKWDYASLIARIIPDRFHPWIVHRTEGRDEQDVFPTVYKANTRRDIEFHAARHGLEVAEFRYLGQYPNYFMFNGALFLLATLYQKLIERCPRLHCLQGWIYFVLRKSAESRFETSAAA